MATNISTIPVASTGATKKKVARQAFTPPDELYGLQDDFEALVAQAANNGHNVSDVKVMAEIRDKAWARDEARYLAKAQALVEAAKEALVEAAKDVLDCSSCRGCRGCTGGAPSGGAVGGGGTGGRS